MTKLISLSLLCCFTATSAFVSSQCHLISPTTSMRCPTSTPPNNSNGRQTVRVAEMADDEPPEGLKALLESPEMMDLMQSAKMQEAMQLVMSGKQDELQARVKVDPELQEIVEKLGEILGDDL
mmetsp:Transcript_14144/g.20892  ORF Transcript_14144/g.20892 Transcript_14144/m.20892 type:complete len:123 (-) Transcript_14144:281-649(-)